MMTADNAWIPRTEILVSHSKMVADVDQKEALASGQFRPLVRKEIETHCANFGLDAELVSHSRMRGLSGGQRVKVVLAACSWQRPHLIVLDEPTNYLDRDSLGALSKALKSFAGGVIIITHSAEFTENLTEEVSFTPTLPRSRKFANIIVGLGCHGRQDDSIWPQLGPRSRRWTSFEGRRRGGGTI